MTCPRACPSSASRSKTAGRRSARSTPTACSTRLFEVHGKEPVADWYTRGAGIARATTSTTSGTNRSSLADLGYNTVVREQIEADGYQLFGTVLVNEQPRLRIYTSDSVDHAADLPSRTSSSASTATVRPDLRAATACPPRSICSTNWTCAWATASACAAIRSTAPRPSRRRRPAHALLAGRQAAADRLQRLHADHRHDRLPQGGPARRRARLQPTAERLLAAGDTIVDRYYIPIFADAPPDASTGCWSACMTAKPATASTFAGRRALGRRLRASRHHGHAAMIAAESGESAGRSRAAGCGARRLAQSCGRCSPPCSWPRSSGCCAAWPSTASSLPTNTPGLPAPATSIALAQGDFAAAFQRHHPGVTVTWAGLAVPHAYPSYAHDAPGYFGCTEEIEPFLRSQGYDPVELLAAGRAVVVLSITMSLTLAFVLAVRLFGLWLAARFALSLPSTSPTRGCCTSTAWSAASCSWR